ncbi:MAG TPA: hypothetical protein VF352_05370, partial [Anaerolineales bacterium]
MKPPPETDSGLRQLVMLPTHNAASRPVLKPGLSQVIRDFVPQVIRDFVPQVIRDFVPQVI